MPKVHNKPIKRPKKDSNIESKSQPKCALVWRTGLSGVPPDSVRCTRELDAELATFGFFGFSPTGRSAPEPGRSAHGLGRSLLFLRTVRSAYLDFCIGSVRVSSLCRGRSASRARTVRAWPVFPKKLLLSGIIYGIPDSRFSIVVD